MSLRPSLCQAFQTGTEKEFVSSDASIRCGVSTSAPTQILSCCHSSAVFMPLTSFPIRFKEPIGHKHNSSPFSVSSVSIISLSQGIKSRSFAFSLNLILIDKYFS